MKLYDLFEQPSNSVPVLRGFAGEWANRAANGEPIPPPPRGISWWAFGRRGWSLDDIAKEFNMDQSYGEGGIVITTNVQYSITNGWLTFERGWGFGVEDEDMIPNDVHDLLQKHNLIKRFTDPTYGFTESMLPTIPLKPNGKDFYDNAVRVWNGLVCEKTVTNYKVWKDFRNTNQS